MGGLAELWRGRGWPLLILLGVGGLHVALAWTAMEGRAGLTGPWPLLQADHGIHYSHALVARVALRETGFSAGYDPSFMAGYPMSIIAGTSFTLVNVLMALAGGVDPAVVYKVTVFACLAALPALMAGAGAWLGASARGVAWGTGLYLVYFWTDFPVNYAGFGMVAFMLVVPVELGAAASLVLYLERGGRGRWVAAALACSLAFFVHLTSPLVLGLGGLAAYAVAAARGTTDRRSFPGGRHLGFWGLAPVVLALNAFWWLPGYWLGATAGETTLAFNHPESLWLRLGQICWGEAPVEPALIGLGLLGLATLRSDRPVAAAGLGGMVAAGFAWGYLAGPFRQLDGLQPGRQTYACYSALCLAAGFGLGEALSRLREARPGRLDRWATLAILLVGVRVCGPSLATQVRQSVLAPTPFLSSRPPVALERLVADLRRHVRPGERLLYEESGFAIPGLADPFGGRHFSAVLPTLTGVEVLGGPYLHTPVTANFTQFGEEKLFGARNWDRARFVRYARLYRPAAIACWTPRARAFCRDNPDLIRTVADDGGILLARVVGFEGATILGGARVEAGPDRLVVRDLVPEADGRVVLRYHLTPCLVADPPVAIEPAYFEDDPVPFIALRPAGDRAGPVTIRMAFPPRAGWLARPRD